MSVIDVITFNLLHITNVCILHIVNKLTITSADNKYNKCNETVSRV